MTEQSHPNIAIRIAAIAGFLALMLAIAGPSIDNRALASHPGHGHLAVDGAVLEHSHDLDAESTEDIAFTYSEAGGPSFGLPMTLSSSNWAEPNISEGALLNRITLAHSQWSPGTFTPPPQPIS